MNYSRAVMILSFEALRRGSNEQIGGRGSDLVMRKNYFATTFSSNNLVGNETSCSCQQGVEVLEALKDPI